MEDATPTYRAAAEILTRGESHRVWSLIVTIFGDLARGPEDRISGTALSRLVGLMGIKPEAMRVALFRLRKDGWIDSQREGRGSLHLLTPFGRGQSAEASPRIYDRERHFPDTWHLLISGSGEQTGRGQLESFLMTGDYLTIGTQVVMGPGPLPPDLHGLAGVETNRWSVPDWVQDQVCPPELMAQYRALEDDLVRIEAILAGAGDLPALERVALRLLTVHSWRRILFRHPDLPGSFFPDGWPGEACRARFCSLMELLPTVSLPDLEAAAVIPESV